MYQVICVVALFPIAVTAVLMFLCGLIFGPYLASVIAQYQVEDESLCVGESK